jgi:hypothetical protein
MMDACSAPSDWWYTALRSNNLGKATVSCGISAIADGVNLKSGDTSCHHFEILSSNACKPVILSPMSVSRLLMSEWTEYLCTNNHQCFRT